MNVLRHLDRLVTSPAAQHMSRAWGGMMNLLVPNPCALCVWSDAEQYHLCRRCTELLKMQCGQVVQAQDFADALPLDLITGQPLPVFAASLYTSELAKLILNFKDHQRIKLAGAFRPIMYRTLQHAAHACHAQSYRVVPIPASNASLRQRGYNPVTTMLPRTMPMSLSYDSSLLKTRWHFFAQTAHHGSGVQARRATAWKKFRLAGHCQPAEPIILVDDVLTTGATLAGATRVLQTAGFDVIAAVVLSAVMPRS